jgi:hypothetical protein
MHPLSLKSLLTLLQQCLAVAPPAQFLGGTLPALKHSSFSLRPQITPITAQSILASYASRRSYATGRRLGPTVPRRYLWKTAPSSFFKWMPPATVPNPIATARVMMLEREANSVPNDVQKQIALWEGLISLKTPVAYERITSRWERMLALVSSFQTCRACAFRRIDSSLGPFKLLVALR